MEHTDFERWKAKAVARLLALVETKGRYYQELVPPCRCPLYGGTNRNAAYGGGMLGARLHNPLMIAAGYMEELVNALSVGSPLRSDAVQVLAATGRLAAIACQLNAYRRRPARKARGLTGTLRRNRADHS